MLLERLLDNLALEVEAFATCQVAPGWRLRLPGLESVTFHYTVQGRGQLLDGENAEALTLSRGSLAVVPPHTAHRIQCGVGPYGEEGAGSGGLPEAALPAHRAGPADEEGLVVVCGSVRVLYGRGLGLFDHLEEVLLLEFGENRKVWSIFEGLLDEVLSPSPGSKAMATALMNESLIHVFRRLCSRADCSMPWLDALEDPDLEPALEAMLQGPEQPHTVATLAELCYLSRSAFSDRFTAAFGRPPMEYLRGIRLRSAAQLLRKEPPLPVRAVASRVGYRSRSQFSRAFKEYFGCSPSEFAA